MAQLGELGLMGVAISEENGGTGLDYLVRQHGTFDEETDKQTDRQRMRDVLLTMFEIPILEARIAAMPWLR